MCVGVLCLVIDLLSSSYCPFWFPNHLAKGVRGGFLTFVGFLLSCGCWCSVYFNPVLCPWVTFIMIISDKNKIKQKVRKGFYVCYCHVIIFCSHLTKVKRDLVA